MIRQRIINTLCLPLIGAMVAISLAACVHLGDRPESGSDIIVISVVGTNDVHGELLPQQGKGGLTTLSGYVAALRQARARDGGLLLVDAGDMWQGTLESNLNEGAAVVAAYNSLGYAAAAIGNHEFDFGPEGAASIPEQQEDDPRGALKKRATEANFPLLAANIIDMETDAPVTWDNVRPSTLVNVAGINIGIVGAITESTPYTTISANTIGLRIGSLRDAIQREAGSLRNAGADLVIVVAHAGSRCEAFDDPDDLSSCDTTGRFSGEILRAAAALPPGLVDHIVGGHVHQGIAHYMNGAAVTASYSNTRAFSRVDFTIDRATRRIVDRKVFPPQPLCPSIDTSNGECVWLIDERAALVRPARYEDIAVRPLPAILEIANQAARDAAQIKMDKVGIVLEAPFTTDGNPESALGNLVLEAIHESVGGDVVFHNVHGGLRNSLPAGELVYGSVFQMFPFDNRVVILDMSGAELRKIIAGQVHNHRRRAGIWGIAVTATCSDGRLALSITRDNGQEIQDRDRLNVAVNDFLATGGDDILTAAMPESGFEWQDDPRLIRDVIVDWLRARGGSIHPDQFQDPGARRWNVPESLPASCLL